MYCMIFVQYLVHRDIGVWCVLKCPHIVLYDTTHVSYNIDKYRWRELDNVEPPIPDAQSNVAFSLEVGEPNRGVITIHL